MVGHDVVIQCMLSLDCSVHELIGRAVKSNALRLSAVPVDPFCCKSVDADQDKRSQLPNAAQFEWTIYPTLLSKLGATNVGRVRL